MTPTEVEALARELKIMFPQASIRYNDSGVAICLGTDWYNKRSSLPMYGWTEDHPDLPVSCMSGYVGENVREMVL